LGAISRGRKGKDIVKERTLGKALSLFQKKTNSDGVNAHGKKMGGKITAIRERGARGDLGEYLITSVYVGTAGAASSTLNRGEKGSITNKHTRRKGKERLPS